jgi:hypothetical protein
MSRQFTRDFYAEVAKGNVAGHTIITRNARNPDVGTSIEDVWTVGGVRTWLQANTALEVVSDDANDTSAGTGARTVTIEGVQIDGTFVSQDVTMNGVTPVALGTNIARVNAMFVATAGTYASTTAGSNAGNIICRIPAGATQAEILLEDTVPEGQSQTSHYSILSTQDAYIIGIKISVDTGKEASILFRSRANYNTVAAPFSPGKTLARFDGVIAGLVAADTAAPIGGPLFLPALSDFWISAISAAGSASVSIQTTFLLVDI